MAKKKLKKTRMPLRKKYGGILFNKGSYTSFKNNKESTSKGKQRKVQFDRN